MPRRHAYEDSYDRDRRDYRDPFLEEEEVEYHRHAPGRPVMERERVRERGASPPEFLREDYGRSATAGPMVLSSRDREPEYRHRERPRKPDRDEHEEIMYRRGPERERVPPREYERERRGPPIEREEDVAIKRRDYERDDYAPRRERPHDREEDEVIIRRGGGDKSRKYEGERDDYRYRPISHERERERAKPRSKSDDRDEEIIIRRDERQKSRGKRDTTDRDEVIIRKHEESDSSSSSESAAAPQEPPTVRAPPIHQDVVTHHRHVDHGYQVVPPPRAPSPDSPPRDNKLEEIDIRRRGERDGRSYDDEIILGHREKEDIPRRAASARRRSSPVRDRGDEEEAIVSRNVSRPQPRGHELVIRERDHNHDRRDEQDIRDEAEYYNRRTAERSRIGEAYNGATRDWEIVDVPPGTKRVTMDGVGGGSQDISWQRYNGVRRSKFKADGEEYSSDRDLRGHDRDRGHVGKRYHGVKDRRDNLWTEITKDLVIKEAIEKLGYDYEETDYFYYVIAYLRYDDIEALVALSEELRQSRRDRMREIERERAMMSRPTALPAPAPKPLMLERPPQPWDEERIYERDLVVDRERRGAPRPLGRGARW